MTTPTEIAKELRRIASSIETVADNIDRNVGAYETDAFVRADREWLAYLEEQVQLREARLSAVRDELRGALAEDLP